MREMFLGEGGAATTDGGRTTIVTMIVRQYVGYDSDPGDGDSGGDDCDSDDPTTGCRFWEMIVGRIGSEMWSSVGAPEMHIDRAKH